MQNYRDKGPDPDLIIPVAQHFIELSHVFFAV